MTATIPARPDPGRRRRSCPSPRHYGIARGGRVPDGQAADGPEALDKLRQRPVDLMLLDIGLPGMSGLDVLAHARAAQSPPRVVMMTADDTPEALLRSFRGQAHWFVRKPFPPTRIVEVVNDVLKASAAAALPIAVCRRTPEWLELVAPCSLEDAERVAGFRDAARREAAGRRAGVGRAGVSRVVVERRRMGRTARPTRTVRISCLRSQRMLLYRIADPGEGFDIDRLAHAAISNPEDDPLGTSASARRWASPGRPRAGDDARRWSTS